MSNRHNKESVEEPKAVKCDYANMLVTKKKKIIKAMQTLGAYDSR